MVKEDKPKTSSSFLNSPEGKQFIINRYVNGEESVYSMAKELGCYENKLYRAMRKHGIARREKGEAQRIALKSGRFTHPTEGKERTQDEKQRIGETIHNYWEDLSDEKKKKRVEKCRELWYKVPEEQREAWNQKSFEALRQAAEHGSKFEKYLLTALMSKKYVVQPHKKFLFEDSETSVDIFFPVELICVEINGPSHYYPFWGKEQFEKTVERDLFKIEQLMACGYKMIVIQNPKGYHSKTVLRMFTEKFLPFLDKAIKSDEDYFEILV